MKSRNPIETSLAGIAGIRLNPLDLIPRNTFAEKMIDLALDGPPQGAESAQEEMLELAGALSRVDTKNVKVVVLGGGTGLSNIIGGDSRTPMWPFSPFRGLKDLFPKTKSIVCVTDDGGSTGELLRRLPIIALGDLRHVLLSSIQLRRLQDRYGAGEGEAEKIVGVLHTLIGFRFSKKPASPTDLLCSADISLDGLPGPMAQGLWILLEALFSNSLLNDAMGVPHCLGNLLLAAAIYQEAGNRTGVTHNAVLKGIRRFASLVGAPPDAVLPCTTTTAQLKVLYSNGVLVSGEYKSSIARRGYPVDRVFVDFSDQPVVPSEVLTSIKGADIIILAPGSTYTSIVPILQVPGIADAIRKNRKALKVLVANLWVQKGETDLVHDNPSRRYYISDLIMAYHRNIPGGVENLFRQVMVLGLQRIPGDVLQNYAVEEKIPIYLDQARVCELGFEPVEAMIFSRDALRARKVVQHDPSSMAVAIRTLWAIKRKLPKDIRHNLPVSSFQNLPVTSQKAETPSERMNKARQVIQKLSLPGGLADVFIDVFWKHRDILIEHLGYIKGAQFIKKSKWKRSLEWDNVLSFYDPDDGFMKIHEDLIDNPERLEVAILVALGESLLGNYTVKKEILPLKEGDEFFGKLFCLTLRPPSDRVCFFLENELHEYLTLVRMNRSGHNPLYYRRVINGSEAFTPAGLMFGLLYAWYLDNRFASHIEYKMSIMKVEVSDLIPEQIHLLSQRRALVEFFRKRVFRVSIKNNFR